MWILIFVVLIVCALIGIGFFLQKENLPFDTVDTALVFGTGLAWKAKTRREHAAKLFHNNVIGNILVSGGVLVPETDLTEAEWFREELLKLGIPPDKIWLENRATNAAENVEFAIPILQEQNFSSVVLVMSDFTGLRAYLTAKKAWQGHDFQIYNSHAPSAKHWNRWTWWLSREGWHLTKYVVARLFRYDLLRYL